MPLGDSITRGSNSRGGYQCKLEKLLSEKQIKFIFVGSVRDDTIEIKNKSHEGHSGFRINQISNHISNQISNHISTWILSKNPDIILLLIGINDIWIDEPNENPNVSDKIRKLKKLLISFLALAPDAKVVLSSSPPTGYF